MACFLPLRYGWAHIHDASPVPTPKDGDLLQADLQEQPLKHIMLHLLQDPAWYRPKLTSRARSLGNWGYTDLARAWLVSAVSNGYLFKEQLCQHRTPCKLLFAWLLMNWQEELHLGLFVLGELPCRQKMRKCFIKENILKQFCGSNS